MRIFRSLLEASRDGMLRGGAVAIGNFDGVHLGHQRLIAGACERAAARGARSGVLTFHPHPVQVLRPKLAPPMLTPLPRKLEILAGLGLDATVVQPFDLAYAGTSVEEFVDRDLHGGLGVVDVVVGWDFTAGRERARVDALRGLLAARGIALHVVEPVTSDGLVVSSTKVRQFILAGEVEGAAELLTRPYDVDGVVSRGAGRGRGLGFATANLATAQLLPANGVYVVRATVGGVHGPDGRLSGGVEYGGVCNVGVKPTVESAGRVSAEAHLFDFDGRDLYSERIRVAFIQRLRDEQRFSSLDALREQIGRDVTTAHEVLRRAR